MDAEQFGRYLRELRSSKGLTLEELGKRVQLTKGHLSNMEHGKRGVPAADLLKKFSDALGVSYAELLLRVGHVDEAFIKEQQDSYLFSIIIDSLEEVFEEIRAVKPGEYVDQYEQLLADALAELEFSNRIDVDTLKNKLYDNQGNSLLGTQRHADRITDLLDTLVKIRSEQRKQNLRDRLEKTKVAPSPKLNELTLYLEQKTDLAYNGHKLTELERQRIADMLQLMFPNYSKGTQ